MIPDLGQYALPVLAAYGGSITALALLIGLSVRRSRRVAAQLAEVETKIEAQRV